MKLAFALIAVTASVFSQLVAAETSTESNDPIATIDANATADANGTKGELHVTDVAGTINSTTAVGLGGANVTAAGNNDDLGNVASTNTINGSGASGNISTSGLPGNATANYTVSSNNTKAGYDINSPLGTTGANITSSPNGTNTAVEAGGVAGTASANNTINKNGTSTSVATGNSIGGTATNAAVGTDGVSVQNSEVSIIGNATFNATIGSNGTTDVALNGSNFLGSVSVNKTAVKVTLLGKPLTV